MKAKRPNREIEIKLRVRDIAMIRERLAQIGAEEIVPRTFESNALYDTPRQDLRRRGKLLRIRVEEPVRNQGALPINGNSAAILTYKAPFRPSRRGNSPAGGVGLGRKFKIREEVEVSFNGAGEIVAVLRALGLAPTFRYEKFRTTFSLPNERGLKIELDETPIGVFLELEGPVRGIKNAARLLGFAPADFLQDTYGALYLAECRRQRRKPAHMVFSQKKLR